MTRIQAADEPPDKDEIVFEPVKPEQHKEGRFYPDVTYNCGKDRDDATRQRTVHMEYVNDREGILVLCDGRGERRELDKLRVARISIEKPWVKNQMLRRLFG